MLWQEAGSGLEWREEDNRQVLQVWNDDFRKRDVEGDDRLEQEDQGTMTDQVEDWISLANDNSFITLDEVKKWLRVSRSYHLKKMIEYQAFPMPAYGTSTTDRITAMCRWRVGDIREWLKTGKRLDTFAVLPDRIREGIIQREKDRMLKTRIINAGINKSFRLHEAEEESRRKAGVK